MIIKDKITLGAIDVEIYFDPDLHCMETNEQGEEEKIEMFGVAEYINYKIGINSSMTPEKQFLALLHELKHMIHYILGYSDDEMVKLDEKYIIGVQHYEYQAFKQISEWQGD